MIDVVDTAIMVFADGQIQYINQAFKKLFRLPSLQYPITMDQFFELIGTAYLNLWKGWLDNSKTYSNTAARKLCLCKDAQGGERLCWVRATSFEGEQKTYRLFHFAPVFEPALRFDELAYWVYDGEQKQEFWNNRLYNLIGLKAEQQARIEHYMSADAWSNFWDQMEKCMRTGQAFEEVIEIDNKRIHKYLRISAEALIRQKGVKAYLKDETASYLKNATLWQDAKNAEKAIQASNHYLALMSHEFRTPLNSVVGTVKLLEDSTASDRIQEELSTLSYAANYILSLSKDVLDYRKLLDREYELKLGPIHLRNTVQEVLNSFDRLAKLKSLRLLLSMEDSLPEWVETDKTRFIQVLNNLISNAIKFTMEGNVKVHIDQIGSGEDFVLKLQVEDTGQGIQASKLKHLFELFNPESDAQSHSFLQTDLGLSITKQIIDLMGGDIHVQSRVGKGTTFRLQIPMKQAKSEQILTKTTLSSQAKEITHESKRILVVDDNQVNLKIIQKFFSKWGFEADFTISGMEALDRIESDIEYALVLMDLQMPQLDGFEATHRIREKLNAKELPIIALTAEVIGNVEEAIEEAGMQGLIFKPFNPIELKEKIASFIDGVAK